MLRFFAVTCLCVIFLAIQGLGQKTPIQPRPPPGPQDPNCPERDGRFPVPDQCDAYIECKDGQYEEKLCPDGLFFNDELPHFSYPCQYPIDVDCGTRTKIQPAQPTAECPHQFGYFRVGDAQHCGQFKNCADGRGYTFDCPEGLAFNPDTYRCDWPDEVPDCDSEGFLQFACPEVAKHLFFFGQPEYRFHRSPVDCQRYFLCIKGKPRLYNCGVGNAFNELTNACDDIENVTSCADGPFSKEFRGPPTKLIQNQV